MNDFLKELFANFDRISDCTEKCYKEKIEDFINWEKPDFVALIGPESPEVISYERNLGLNFHGKEETVFEAVKNIIEEQKETIVRIDIRTMKFLFDISTKPMDILFKLRFNICFKDQDVRTLIRKIHVVEVSKAGKPKVGLMGVTDVTSVAKGERIVFEAKTINEEILNSPIYKEFLKDINKIINGSIFLTKRERQILQKIAEGKTSQQISQELEIAKTTVDKHRQNMLKKHNVSNITSLLRMMS